MAFEEDYFGLEKKRYETKEINTRLNPMYRYILWTLIDSLREEKKLDCLQVFEFVCEKDEQGRYIQKLTHSQEETSYSKTYDFPVNEPVNEKVYVIDDGEQCTMLFTEEY